MASQELIEASASAMAMNSASTLRRASLRNSVLILEMASFNRIQVRRVWRQVQEPCAAVLGQRGDLRVFVTCEVVHHHHLSRLQDRHHRVTDEGDGEKEKSAPLH